MPYFSAFLLNMHVTCWPFSLVVFDKYLPFNSHSLCVKVILKWTRFVGLMPSSILVHFRVNAGLNIITQLVRPLFTQRWVAKIAQIGLFSTHQFLECTWMPITSNVIGSHVFSNQTSHLQDIRFISLNNEFNFCGSSFCTPPQKSTQLH